MKLNPSGANSEELRMLRLIEHNQRIWHWANTKAAKSKETAPEPTLLPGEEEVLQAKSEQEEKNAADLAAQFGLKL